MELMNTEILNKEEEIYLLLSYLRLKEDLRLVEKEMDDNAPKDYSGESNVFKREFGKGIVNPLKRAIVRDLSEQKKKAMDNLDDFEAKNGKVFEVEEDELKGEIREFFKEDHLREARMMMAIRLCLAEDYEYVDAEESMKKVSDVLFGNEEEAWNVYSALKANYYRLNKQDLRNVEKGILIGLGIVTAATLIAGPIGLTAAAATSSNAAAALGAVAAAGAGAYGVGVAKVTVALVAAEILLTGATCGVLTAIEIRKNKELKKQFREISADSLALKLAIKATLIEDIKRNATEEDLQSYLDDALQVLDDYRADAEYMMIVEKLDAKNAKKKIAICNNLSGRLAEIVGI